MAKFSEMLQPPFLPDTRCLVQSFTLYRLIVFRPIPGLRKVLPWFENPRPGWARPDAGAAATPAGIGERVMGWLSEYNRQRSMGQAAR